ncbi:MAG: GAF domain-containing protein [Verrucomicrobia bacterium]|nr:GAF domain-containing protein [Leptolyngbya sp. ES-bin-22]
MLMLTSSEFIALCRAQVVLLTQALGASLSVVYLTDELADGAETQLIPVIAYPETATDWQARRASRSLMSAIATAKPTPRFLTNSPSDLSQVKQLSASAPERLPIHASESLSDCLEPNVDHAARPQSNAGRAALVAERRVVLPLMHEDVVLGLLVTERSDRPWTEREQTQIHQIAETLAIACVLDQRYRWLKQDHRQQQQLQAQQHDLLDNLLHQFRNSLTALQTFGKLILKRLLPEDANREVAASLVRETARLRDLAEQLEAAVAETDAARMPQLVLPPGLDDRQLGDRTADEGTTLQQRIQPLPLLPAAGLLSGKPLILEPCAIATVLEPLLASTSAIAQDRALTLLTDIPADLPPVQAHVQILREVLSNAIDNALKYTPAGGLVLVQARLVQATVGITTGQTADGIEQKLEIAITDTGPGIPPQDLRHLFERRYRGVQAQTGIPGSGLGLSIARALVTQMQGEIDVFSPARVNGIKQHRAEEMANHGSGTTVVVRLAIVQPQDSEP